MKELLRYDHVQVCFNGQPVVHDVTFALKQGEILGIAGESGSGKSTLLRAAMGLLGPGGMVTRGDIWFEGKDLPELSQKQMERIRGKRLGMIFQDAAASLCPIRKIGSQICEAMGAKKRTDKALVRAQAQALFEKMNLSPGDRIWDSYPFELSGGMSQRICIAIAILMGPDILLADEPTSALDTRAQKQILEEILKLKKEEHMSVIIVSHDIAVIRAIADTVMILKDGNVMEYGPAGQVLTCPENPYTKLLLEAAPRLKPHKGIPLCRKRHGIQQ